MRNIKQKLARLKSWLKMQYQTHKNCRLIRKHFGKRYYNFMNSYLAGNISPEDITNFTTFEPTIFNTLKMINEKKAELIKEQAYKARMERDETLCDLMLREAESEQALLIEEELRVSQNPANSTEDIQQKILKLEQTRKKLEQTEFIIADLTNLKEALHPKRKPGRPPKNPKAKATPKPKAQAVEPKGGDA